MSNYVGRNYCLADDVMSDFFAEELELNWAGDWTNNCEIESYDRF